MNHPHSNDESSQGIVLAAYTRRPTVQIFFILFFIALFIIGADIVFFHRIVTDPAPLKVLLAAIADMIMSVVLLVFLVRQAIRNRVPLAITDRGISVRFMDFRTINTFIPWDRIVGISTTFYLVHMIYKSHYLVIRVDPGFPLPKQNFNVLNLAPNELPVELNHLSRKPEEIVQDMSNYLAQFSRRA